MSDATSERVDAERLRAWREEGVEHRIVDVRTPGEFESVHIPGSHNIPIGQLGEHRDELQRHVSDPVVLVCRSGRRAQDAERRLADGGMRNIRVLEGGILAWQARTGRSPRPRASDGTSSAKYGSSPGCSS